MGQAPSKATLQQPLENVAGVLHHLSSESPDCFDSRIRGIYPPRATHQKLGLRFIDSDLCPLIFPLWHCKVKAIQLRNEQ